MSGDVEIQVGKDVIKPIIEAKVQAAIVEALGMEKNLVERTVCAALEQKVDKDGKRSRYDSDNKYTMLEAMCNQYILKAARAALETLLQKQQGKIEEAIVRRMTRDKSKMVNAFADGMRKSLESSWRFGVTVKFDSNEE